jgi:hypothetical protein
MRREILEPDADGRVPLAQLGLEGELIIADEVEPGKWVLTSEHAAGDAREPAADEEIHERGVVDDDEMAFGHGATDPTASYGRSVSRVERPASMPPPGPRKRS